MFRSIKLNNFKCFENLEKPVEFSQVNLLTGSNGRGKSTIFQSLLLLAQSYEAGKDFKAIKLSGRFLSLGLFKDIVNEGIISKEVRISLVTDNDEFNTLEFVCKGSEERADAIIDNIYVDGDPMASVTAMGTMGNVDGMLSSEEKTFIPTSTYESFSQLANVYYVSADREGPINAVKMHEGNINEQIGIHGERVLNSLYERKDTFQSRISKELSTILGGASVHVSSSDMEYIRMLVDSKDNSLGYKPVNVGFGYSYILPVIILPLIIPYGSKLFIENPEAHLHPGAQSRMMEFLIRTAKQRGLQLFIETHSDHVVNAARIAVKHRSYDLMKDDVALVHLDRTIDERQPEVWQIKMDVNGNLSDYPHDFLEEWGNQMSQLI